MLLLLSWLLTTRLCELTAFNTFLNVILKIDLELRLILSPFLSFSSTSQMNLEAFAARALTDTELTIFLACYVDFISLHILRRWRIISVTALPAEQSSSKHQCVYIYWSLSYDKAKFNFVLLHFNLCRFPTVFVNT